mmetsp:Transcript_6402/g.15590  ORF Transcript_6402/g.15590 Transcript_6402/m.15590 type:complete len:440 (+) Transcript_6402:559-1878(+)
MIRTAAFQPKEGAVAVGLPSGEADVLHAPQIFQTESGQPEALDQSVVVPGEVFHLSDQDFSKKSDKKSHRERVGKAAKQVADCLQERQYAVIDNFISADDVGRIRADVDKLEAFYEPSEIWVGKQAAAGAQVRMPSVRGDKVLWMCGFHPDPGVWTNVDGSSRNDDYSQDPGSRERALEPCSRQVRETLQNGGVAKVSKQWQHRSIRELLSRMDRLVLGMLRSRVSRLAKLGHRSDSMLAVYPGDMTRFQKHIDNTAGDGRRLTCLCYFNPSWQAGDGGELVVHPPGVDRPISVPPLGGRLALFFSDVVPHEVLPTAVHRYSVNLWFYDEVERASAIRSAKELGHVGGSFGKTSEKEQREAQTFLALLLTSQATLDTLLPAAEKLSGAAREIAGAVVGGSGSAFMEGMRQLTESSLAELRRNLSTMGGDGSGDTTRYIH